MSNLKQEKVSTNKMKIFPIHWYINLHRCKGWLTDDFFTFYVSYKKQIPWNKYVNNSQYSHNIQK